jgi:hypothetical protein
MRTLIERVPDSTLIDVIEDLDQKINRRHPAVNVATLMTRLLGKVHRELTYRYPELPQVLAAWDRDTPDRRDRWIDVARDHITN